MTRQLKSRPSWRDKLEKQQDPKIVTIPPKMVKRFGDGKMLIPRPLDVDRLMRKIPEGKLATQSLIREKLAKEFRADVACPMTTGIFFRIAAEAAEEDRQRGEKQITPYWRVLRDDGSLNVRFPGGVSAQAGHLKGEGHILDSSNSKKPKVKNFQSKLITF